jgi:UDP-2-acetamido-2-deoxy-ribo-hexuluronate aminotransferase
MPPIDFSGVKEQTRRYADQINVRIQRVIEHACFIMGPEVVELEVALASYVGVKHCISVASGTTGLEIALRALGVGPGDEVITVPFTWISTAEVIRLVGARPVFVDIDPHTYMIDVDLLAPAMTEKTRAIIPVSLFGQMPDLERIASIAAERGVPVVEDAAQSFGATRRGRRSAGVTTIGCTSFFPAKPLGCYGDGGALFTSDDDLADKMRAIRTHGGLRRHDHPLLGTNGRLDTIQAAILLAKLPHFDWEARERERLGARYSASLRPSCVPPLVAPFNTHVYAQYTIRVAHREQAAEKLKTAGVPTGIYYPKCLHEQPVFSDLGYRIGDFVQSEKASREVLSLPMHSYLTQPDQDRIVELVNEFCDRCII